MKKIYACLILIFAINSVNGQIDKDKAIIFDYTVFYNTEYPIMKKAKLIVKKNQLESMFIVYPKELNTKKIEFEEKSNLLLNFGSNLYLFNYINKNKNEILTKDHVLNEEYIIKEQIPKFNWVLIDEEKKNGDNVLYKAKTNFRGRSYVAWYSLDFPIEFGPWKFNGLPGLIFEIYDETNRYQWQLQAIDYDSSINNHFEILNKTRVDTITIKQYAHLRYNKDIDLKIDSKLPRGMKIISTKTKRPYRNDIEIKFEWEEN